MGVLGHEDGGEEEEDDMEVDENQDPRSAEVDEESLPAAKKQMRPALKQEPRDESVSVTE